MSEPQEGWQPDPTGRHELRFHNGTRWTEHVVDNHEQTVDPLGAPGDHGGQETPGEKRGLVQRAKDVAQRELEREREVRAIKQAPAESTGPPPEWLQAHGGPAAPPTAATPEQRFQYRVEIARETMFGDKIKHDSLQELLNKYALHGWQLKTITSANVGGRVGPGGTSGLLVTFERPVR